MKTLAEEMTVLGIETLNHFIESSAKSLKRQHTAGDDFGALADSPRISRDDITDVAQAIHTVMQGRGADNKTKLKLINQLMDRPVLHQSDKPHDSRRKAGSLTSALADVVCDHIVRVAVDDDLSSQAELLMKEFVRKSCYFRVNWRQHSRGLSSATAGVCLQSLASIRPQENDVVVLVAQTPRALISAYSHATVEGKLVTLEYFVATAGGVKVTVHPESTIKDDTGCIEMSDVTLSPATSSKVDGVLLTDTVQATKLAGNFLAKLRSIDEIAFTGDVIIDASTGQIIDIHLRQKEDYM